MARHARLGREIHAPALKGGGVTMRQCRFCLLYGGLRGMRCCIESQGGVKKDNNIELRAASLLGYAPAASLHPLYARTLLSLRHLLALEIFQDSTGGSHLLAIMALSGHGKRRQESKRSLGRSISLVPLDRLRLHDKKRKSIFLNLTRQKRKLF